MCVSEDCDISVGVTASLQPNVGVKTTKHKPQSVKHKNQSKANGNTMASRKQVGSEQFNFLAKCKSQRVM